MKLSLYRQVWIGPRLSATNHEVTSPDDDEYNCVAWALGFTDRWAWPGRDDAWWPEGIRDDDSVESFVGLFRTVGFELCDSAELEAGYERLALFASAGLPSHVARQVPTGSWTSKLGGWEDLRHDSPDVLEGGRYGRVVAVLRRRMAG